MVQCKELSDIHCYDPALCYALLTLNSFTMASTRFSLVYRGNAIDGWISTFIAYTALRSQGEVAFYPIYANQPINDKQLEAWKGSHVLLLDLSVDLKEREKMTRAGILSVECRDHHATSIPHWPADSGVIDTSICTAMAVWNHWYSHQEKPFWLHAVDRISRWDHPTVEDRSLREVLTVVSRLPPQDALGPTEAFMTWAGQPLGPEFSSLMNQGYSQLAMKDHELIQCLTAHGRFHEIQESDLASWGLSPDWLGTHCFILDNSDFIIDTNEAAWLTFLHNPHINVFINYRKKVRRDPKNDKLKMNYLYSARARPPFDLTAGDFFQGNSTSAGAMVPIVNGAVYPFLPVVA